MTIIKPLSLSHSVEPDVPIMPRRDSSAPVPPAPTVTSTHQDLVVLRGEVRNSLSRTSDAFVALETREVARFEDVNERMAAGFAAADRRVDAGFARVNDRFATTDGRINKVEHMMSDVLSLLHNAHSYRPMDTILPRTVPVSPLTGTARPLPDVPGTVGKFWKLQEPQKHAQLLSMVLAYDVTEEWRTWGRFTSFDLGDDSEDDEPEQSTNFRYDDVTMAVSSHPRIAVRKLAQVFGLDFQKIQDLVRRTENRRNEAAITKRKLQLEQEQRSIDVYKRQQREGEVKRQRTAAEPPRRPIRETPSEEREYIGWDCNPNNSPRPHAVIQDAPRYRNLPVQTRVSPVQPAASLPRGAQLSRNMDVDEDSDESDAPSQGSTIPDSYRVSTSRRSQY